MVSRIYDQLGYRDFGSEKKRPLYTNSQDDFDQIRGSIICALFGPSSDPPFFCYTISPYCGSFIASVGSDAASCAGPWFILWLTAGQVQSRLTQTSFLAHSAKPLAAVAVS